MNNPDYESDRGPSVILLQIQEPDANGFHRATVTVDGLPETEAGCLSPHLMGIVHWLSSELQLRIVQRLFPPGDDSLKPGLFVMETMNP